MPKIVTRFGPSPSGSMHIGNLRSALYSWLYAKQNNGKFILRIEDTDKTRSKAKSVAEIKQVLKDCGLTWDEYYQQSKRLSIYQYYAHKMLSNGSAYICQCAKDTEDCQCHLNRNEVVNKDYCIKLTVVGKGFDTYDIVCKDELRGEVKYNSKELYDIVLLKADGYPTYHLASIIDDILMGVTDVFRGDEWLSSLPYHKLIYDALQHSMPKFYHLPLICNEEGKKLSKRDGDFSVNTLLQSGILPSAILNYIALLGWHPSGNAEFFTIEDLIENFSIDRLTKSPACYDAKKLKNLNLKHAKTGRGIREFNDRYTNIYASPRRERLLPIFQVGIDVDQLMNKCKYASRNITVHPKRIDFFRELVNQLDSLNLNPADKFNFFMNAVEAKNMLQHISDCGYNNKDINEWIRESLTNETKGLPAEVLLTILSFEELKDIFEHTGLLKM